MSTSFLTPQTVESMVHALKVLSMAALLGAALGIVRPVRRGIVPRSAHVIQAQILLAVVGAMIVVVVAESLARAFAVVGVAGLIRYRSRIEDPKDAGVMLVALVIGLACGTNLFAFATVACLFVIAVLWLLESFEPAAKTRFDLKIETRDAGTLQKELEDELRRRDLAFDLRGSSSEELHYEVTVPYQQQVRELSQSIRALGDRHGAAVDWEIKKFETVLP
jgi:hypothetical protein